MTMVTPKYTKRLLARVTIECETPLSLRSGTKSIMTDAEVAKDINGLPYIPGTSIAGVLRHLANGTESESLFGKSGDIDGEGSKVIFTDAIILAPDGKAVDGLADVDEINEFYYKYTHLPIRQHVAINGRGTAKDGAKFDNEVVYAGTRFCFEMELVTDSHDEIVAAEKILSNLHKDTFRLGGGTRHGYGAMKAISCKLKEYDLTDHEDLIQYISRLNTLVQEAEGEETIFESPGRDDKYSFTLQPDDFFMFGSGHGDDQADATPVVEDIVVWNGGKAAFIKGCTLIPASSIKGAISHRLAFNFNKLMERYADKPDTAAKPAEENEAVRSLMGYEDGETHLRGALIFSDILIPRHLPEGGFNHIRIDSFTSAAINGALFNEKAFFKDGKAFETSVVLNRTDFERNLSSCGTDCYKDKIIEALELTFNDLCSGLLPLGGLANKGFGRFTGTWKKA